MADYDSNKLRNSLVHPGANAIVVDDVLLRIQSEIYTSTPTMSAQGDQNDLMNWLGAIKSSPTKVFLVNWENQTADEPRNEIQEKYGYGYVIPLLDQEVEL